MTVNGTHPLAEIILRKLFSIESCPKEEQERMVQRACKTAVEWHDKEIADLKAEIERKDEFIRSVIEWEEAYSTDIFNEPTPEQVDAVCKQLGFRIDRISAMVLRKVSKSWAQKAREALQRCGL